MVENLTDEQEMNGVPTHEQKMRELLLYRIQEKLNNLSFQQLEELYKGMLATEQAANNGLSSDKAKVLKDLLVAAYGADGVRRLAANYAYSVYQEFSASALTSDVANAVIRYFHEQDKIPALLQIVKKQNPYQLVRFKEAILAARILPEGSTLLD